MAGKTAVSARSDMHASELATSVASLLPERACRVARRPLLDLPSTAGAGDVYEFITLIVCILPRPTVRLASNVQPFLPPQSNASKSKLVVLISSTTVMTTVCPSVRVLPPPLCHGSSRPPPRLFSQLLNLKSRIRVCCDSLGPWPCFAPSARVYTTRAITHSRTGSQQYGQIFMLAAQRSHAS